MIKNNANNIKQEIAKAFFSDPENESENKLFLKYSTIMFWMTLAAILLAALAGGIGCGITDTVLGINAFIAKKVILAIVAAFNLSYIGLGIYYLTLLYPRFSKYNKFIKWTFNLLIVLSVFMIISVGASLSIIIVKNELHKQWYFIVPVALASFAIFLTAPIPLGIIRSFKLQKKVVANSKVIKK